MQHSENETISAEVTAKNDSASAIKNNGAAITIACVAGGIVWVRDQSFGGGAVFQKKGVGTRRYFSRLRRSLRLRRQISLDYITTAPPANLTRLLHNIASYAAYNNYNDNTTTYLSISSIKRLQFV